MRLHRCRRPWTHAARRPLIAATVAALAACSPTLDWREVRPEDSRLTLLFPCKPASHAREVRLDGSPRRMVLYACEAGDSTFALGQVAVSDPREVDPALTALRTAAAANVQAGSPTAQAFLVPGATPSVVAGRIDASGRLPGGDAGELSAVFFVQGTSLFQATVFGRRLDREAVDTYFSGLKLAR